MARKKEVSNETTEVMDEQIQSEETKEIEETNQAIVFTEDDKRVLFYKKKAELRRKMLEHKLIVDGYNDQQKFEYAKAEQYRNILSKFCLEVGLDYHLTGINCMYENIIKSEKMMMTTVIVDVHLIDPTTGYEEVSRQFAQGADNLDKGLFKGNTMILKEYVRNEFGMTLDGDKGVDCEADIVAEPTKPKFVTAEKKEKIANNIISNNATEQNKSNSGEKTTMQFVDTMIGLLEQIREKQPGYGDKTYNGLLEVKQNGELPLQSIMVSRMQAIEKKYNELFGE